MRERRQAASSPPHNPHHSQVLAAVDLMTDNVSALNGLTTLLAAAGTQNIMADELCALMQLVSAQATEAYGLLNAVHEAMYAERRAA